jgi:hypothetical protein
MSLVNSVIAFLQLRKEIKKQKSYNKDFLEPLINELEIKYGGRFREGQLKKIFKYYGLFIPSVLCASFKQLQCKKLTEHERKLATLFGILTPVIDDLFDIDKLPLEDLKSITYTPQLYQPKNFTASVAKHVGVYLLENVKHPAAFTEAVTNIFETQVETLKQANVQLPEDELERLTYEKGGYSVILYHQILDEIADNKMKEALFHIGSLMQFANDAFDIYKDIQEGVITLTTNCDDYLRLKEKYLARIKNTNRVINNLPYSRNRKKQFTIKMYGVIAQGLVALDNMINLQRALGAPLDCKKLSRKQLVVDMQKPKNIIRWMYYTYTLPSHN